MTDVGGLRSRADAAAYRGLSDALSTIACSRSELINSRAPSDYTSNLEAAAARNDLTIAASFLLTDAVVAAATANPDRHFLLVDPTVPPPTMANLLVLSFRRDQGAFLAGALAAMLSKTAVVAGVYGPGGPTDRLERSAFGHGVFYIDIDMRVLGAYQPADAGEPYNNPGWGSDQARAFSAQNADVIFATGAATGVGALKGAAASGRVCIGNELPDGPRVASCVAGATRVSLDRGVGQAIRQLQHGWLYGTLPLGVSDDAVGLDVSFSVPNHVRTRLQSLTQLLADGSLGTGV